jgi:hypothetical protein
MLWTMAHQHLLIHCEIVILKFDSRRSNCTCADVKSWNFWTEMSCLPVPNSGGGGQAHQKKHFRVLIKYKMGKKKKKNENKPWCYYCDRVFDDEAMLVQHQRHRHFKCPDCPKKLNTAQVRACAANEPSATIRFHSDSQGLSTHAYQVHKTTINA